MSDNEKLAARIDALETRLTYQDEIVETLNKTVTAQWKQVDALVRQVLSLADRLQELETGARMGPANEPPPHY